MTWIVKYEGDPVGRVTGPTSEIRAIAEWAASQDVVPPVDQLAAVAIVTPPRRTRKVQR